MKRNYLALGEKLKDAMGSKFCYFDDMSELLRENRSATRKARMAWNNHAVENGEGLIVVGSGWTNGLYWYTENEKEKFDWYKKWHKHNSTRDASTLSVVENIKLTAKSEVILKSLAPYDVILGLCRTASFSMEEKIRIINVISSL